MLCDKCEEREATIHITSIVDGHETKSNLCEECCRDAAMSECSRVATLPLPHGLVSKAVFSMHEWDEDIVARIVEGDPRYQIGAYEFLMEAVDRALPRESRTGKPIDRHISAKQLLDVLRAYALLRFAKDAKRRLNEWGIKSCEDFGEIVFSMVGAGLLGKQPSDRKEDFQGGYSFDEAFPES
jgi:uncharacterized repeat protein (TIGR04138 family)